MKKAVLFDLDGTLLPMPNQMEFVKVYLGLLCKLGLHEPQKLTDVIFKGTKAMVLNDGLKTNEEVFWDVYFNELDEDKTNIDEVKRVYDDFYRHDFDASKVATYDNEDARVLIDKLKNIGLRLILATNPVFPLCAVETRLAWIGLNKSDFEFITTYENMGLCKPNPAYFKEVLKRNNLKAEDVIMIGNDVNDDIKPCLSIGIDSILVTDTMIGDIDSVDVPKIPFKELVNNINIYLE